MAAAIRVENLGKKYRVVQGESRAAYRTLREVLTGAALAPLRKLRGRTAEQREAEDFWALKDVSFEVQPGEVVGIIGRNGAGKSTLLKVLSRITKPTTGRVELNGRVGSLLEVGTGFHPELTGRENVYLNGSILGMSRKEIDRKFDEIVAFAEVEKFLDTPVKRYSSGMYVRLAFAVAAHLEPEILIVDEVLAVGDAQFQKKCMDKLGGIARSGRTVFVVSHNLSQLLKTCQRGIYLLAGTIEFDGPIEIATTQYSNAHIHSGIDKQGRDIVVKIEVATDQGETTDTWRYGDVLVLRAIVESSRLLTNVAIDIVFYSENGTRVFAIQSDRIRGHLATESRHTEFTFRVRNSTINCETLHIDIGVRESPQTHYIAWWQQVRTLVINNADAPEYFSRGSLIGLPCEMTIASAPTNDLFTRRVQS